VSVVAIVPKIRDPEIGILFVKVFVTLPANRIIPAIGSIPESVNVVATTNLSSVVLLMVTVPAVQKRLVPSSKKCDPVLKAIVPAPFKVSGFLNAALLEVFGVLIVLVVLIIGADIKTVDPDAVKTLLLIDTTISPLTATELLLKVVLTPLEAGEKFKLPAIVHASPKSIVFPVPVAKVKLPVQIIPFDVNVAVFGVGAVAAGLKERIPVPDVVIPVESVKLPFIVRVMPELTVNVLT